MDRRATRRGRNPCLIIPMPRHARSSRRPQIAPPAPEFGVRLPRLRKRTPPQSPAPAPCREGTAESKPSTPADGSSTELIDPSVILYEEIEDASLPPRPRPPAGADEEFSRPVAADFGRQDGWKASPGVRYATHLLIFSATLAAGMIWIRWRQDPAAAGPAAPVGTGAPAPIPARRLPAEAFEFVYRLRESTMVGGQLDRQFQDAQEIYRENQFDEFLDLDPWELPLDQLCYLNHFCDKGFFTAEREILIALLESRLNRESFNEPVYPGQSAVAARLGAAVQSHEERINDLRMAIEIYRRGREGEIVVPASLPPDQDQALRAGVVQKLAAERRKRDALDQTLATLQTRLNGRPR
jgi:hypothetical protein